MFASAFSWISDFFRIFGIHSFFRYGLFVEYMNMHGMRSGGQCDVNIPSLSPGGSRSKAVANDYRHSTGVDFEP